MVGYDGHSETERVLVNNEGLAIQSLLKIQSDPLGNLGGDKHIFSLGNFSIFVFENARCIYAVIRLTGMR